MGSHQLLLFQFWAKEYPTAIDKQRVQFSPFDFFKDVAVQGCDFYYVCSFLHEVQQRLNSTIHYRFDPSCEKISNLDFLMVLTE